MGDGTPAQATRKTRLAAIMFTDMKGYSALMGADEKAALALLDEHNGIVVPRVQRHRGRVVKTIGDAVMAEFPSTLDAVNAAVEIQHALHDRNLSVPGATPIVIRVGVHVGDVWEGDGDLLGDGVNVAARLEPQADPGGVCLSGDAWAQVHNKVEIKAETKPGVRLRNIEREVEVVRLVFPWTAPLALAPVPLVPSAAPPVVLSTSSPVAAQVGRTLGGLARRVLGMGLSFLGFFVSLGMVLALVKHGLSKPELLVILAFLGVFPLVVGTRLMRRSVAPPAPVPLDPVKVILRVAAQAGGEVTLTRLAAETPFNLDELKPLLVRLEAEGIAVLTVREDGVLLYRFPEMRADAGVLALKA
jgi:class 3 adenylate cyclase